ncbi:MAG: phosphoribosylglycinamide formyltransferase [Deltaproteobacteria bacterium]|nr:phosphoribosylglycinamide formyltransferase [Deltaproteobacteria bacterium]MBW2210023.1 phosphoribosylglycinamide formyltransferase [Deltaproteobacteria bacterium]MBW2214123.1 phosphoribosylglycinamide formyltransferase [Deltaproteobacteria bacterium]MBW2377978.1 phosphoribosylglycinamide formyltransferase [Deltaproteobacteria bacterium]MBW2549843.1 phosphoribosylglycinamide formyltransferase [Deltaproteobacteria bacterium]
MDVVVLVSGRGSNLRAICSAIDAGTCHANIVGVVSDRKKAAALEFAEGRGIPTRVVSLRKGDDRNAWNDSLTAEVASLEPDLVVLAGFMRVLGAPLLERFPGRIINVHPALLPSFPGHSGPQDALDGGVRVSGCTVHIVDTGVDTGPILAQAAVPVLADDTVDTLHSRIQVQEHRLLPRVIHQIAIGAITLDPLTMSTPVADPTLSLSVPDI